MSSRDDRIEGVLLGTATGDALGAPYEFGPARGPELDVAMGGGRGWEPGEWTDDTAMAIAIAEVAATGVDLRDEVAQDEIVARWHEWSRDAKDVGIQTRRVLTAAGRDGAITAADYLANGAVPGTVYDHGAVYYVDLTVNIPSTNGIYFDFGTSPDRSAGNGGVLINEIVAVVPEPATPLFAADVSANVRWPCT